MVVVCGGGGSWSLQVANEKKKEQVGIHCFCFWKNKLVNIGKVLFIRTADSKLRK